MKRIVLTAVMACGVAMVTQAQNQGGGRWIGTGTRITFGQGQVVVDGAAEQAPAVKDAATRQGKVKEVSATDKRLTLTTQEAAEGEKKPATVEVALTYTDATTVRTVKREDKTVTYVPGKIDDVKAGSTVSVLANKESVAIQITIEPETKPAEGK